MSNVIIVSSTRKILLFLVVFVFCSKLVYNYNLTGSEIGPPVIYSHEQPEEDFYYKALKTLIPEVVDGIIDDPIALLVAFYNRSAWTGLEMYPYEMLDQPQLRWYSKKDMYYTVVMTDVDVPSRRKPYEREFLHWLVGNIPEDQYLKGECMCEYIPPRPAKGTGYHRYAVILYTHKHKINYTERYIGVNDIEQRKRFFTQEFADKYNLGTLAEGGNWFIAAWDHTVGDKAYVKPHYRVPNYR